ncbi:MAG: hypothetical protein ACKPKO_33585, partial [Candidatus Fonsibacter sp.]
MVKAEQEVASSSSSASMLPPDQAHTVIEQLAYESCGASPDEQSAAGCWGATSASCATTKGCTC